MKLQNPKIVFYAQRKFGDKITATFDFVKENWRVMLKYLVYMVLPICLIQSLTMNRLMSEYLGMAMSDTIDTDISSGVWLSLIANYGLTILFMMIGSMLISALVYTFMSVYNEREERLTDIKFADFKSAFYMRLTRYILLIVFGIALGILAIAVVVLLAVLSPWTLMITIPLLFVCAIPLTLFVPVYLFEEKITIFQAFTRSLRLGFATWGGVFAVSFVIGIIANIVSGITMMPWYVATIVKQVFIATDIQSDVMVTPGYSFIIYVFGIIQAFGLYLAMALQLIAVAYQYGHAREKVDNVSVVSDIENFEQL